MFKSLTEWRDRRKYRARLTRNLKACFEPMPVAGFRLLMRTYPGVRDAADAGFRSGANCEEESIRAASAILADFLPKVLSRHQCALLLERLGIPEGAEQPDIDPAAERWKTIVLAMEGWAFDMVRLGCLESRWRDLAMNEVLGALRGLDADERSNRRVMRALEKGLFPDRPSGEG